MGLASAANWTAEIKNSEYDSMYPDDATEFIANPETKEDAAVGYLRSIVLSQVKAYETVEETQRISNLVDAEIVLS